MRRRPRSSRQKALLAASILVGKKAQQAVILDLRKLTIITDYFVICSGISEVHVRALAKDLLAQLGELGVRQIAPHGAQAGRWVLLDLGDVMVHIFMDFERRFYDLEGLWGSAPIIEVT